MENKVQRLTVDDKVGFFLGTVVFIVTLPLSFLMSSLPVAAAQGLISQPVLAATLSFGIIAAGMLLSLVLSMVLGLMLSYGLCAGTRKLRLPALVHALAHRGSGLQLENQRYTPWGAAVGGLVAAVVFFRSGHAPLEIVTERVEHLFPAPLVLNLGQVSSFDLGHAYSVVTGVLTVGFLFAILGIGLGSLVAVVVERLLHRSAA